MVKIIRIEKEKYNQYKKLKEEKHKQLNKRLEKESRQAEITIIIVWILSLSLFGFLLWSIIFK